MSQPMQESAGRYADQLGQRIQLLSGSAVVWLWLRRVALGLIVLWLCLSVAKLILVLLPEPELPQLPVVGTVGQEQQATPALNDISGLLSLNLFGRQGAAEVTPAPAQVLSLPEANAEDTKLNLQLRGVLMSTDPKSARAIIASGSNQDLYAVDDVLPVGRNVKLSKVLAERVIISNAGKPESLWLYDEKNKSLGSSQAVPRYRAPAPATQNQFSERITESRDQVNAGDDSSDDVEAALADATGVNNLTDVIKLSVERRDGQVLGYKIRPGREADLFNELGLQTGDIVTSINGIQLDSSNKVMQVYRELKDQTSATLILLRGDEEMTMDITL